MARKVQRKRRQTFSVLILAAVLVLVGKSEIILAESPMWSGIVAHHTASSHMTLKECNAWHRQRGWDGCGYNYIIDRSGDIIEARGDRRTGAHTKGKNRDLLGVALVGFGGKHHPYRITQKQINGLRILHAELEARYGRLPIYPHSHFGKTDCPGGYIREIIRGWGEPVRGPGAEGMTIR
jgi:hypothetical protein